MQLKRLQDLKKGVAVKKKNTGLCFDFHPTVSQPNQLNKYADFNGAQFTG